MLLRILVFLILGYCINPQAYSSNLVDEDQISTDSKMSSSIHVLTQTEIEEIKQLALNGIKELQENLNNAITTLKSDSISAQECFTRVATYLKAYDDVIVKTRWNRHYLFKTHRFEHKSSLFPLCLLDRETLAIKGLRLIDATTYDSLLNKLTNARQSINEWLTQIE